jgi:phosphoribosylanthranilate isomerase
MLRLPVKVNSITNLSDARYCAGMGVEMIGFCQNETSDRFLSVEKANGIAGWLVGVKIISENSAQKFAAELMNSAEALSAEAIEVWDAPPPAPIQSSLPLLYRFTLSEWEKTKSTLPQEATLHVALEKSDIHQIALIENICKQNTTFLNVSKLDIADIEKLLNEAKPYGLSHDGGNELSPGLSDFEHLAEVLEYLEA